MKPWNLFTLLPWQKRSTSTPSGAAPWELVRASTEAPATPLPAPKEERSLLQEAPLTRTLSWQFWTPERLAASWERNSEETDHA